MPKRLIFISLIQIDSLDERGIYHDLLREFSNNRYDVTIVCPVERVTKIPTRLIKENNVTILQVRVLNIQKCNVIEKGLSTLSLNFLFKRAIEKYIKEKEFDIILFTTPPITLINLIYWLKSFNGAKSYLLLKDIFPQNAVDIGYFKKGGFLHRYFSNIEIKIYEISDKIGCMSPANADYINKFFPQFSNKIEVNPNCIDLNQIPIIYDTKEHIRSKWNIPLESIVFLYGGNLGKPQGTEFLLEVISNCIDQVPNAYFLIVGDGTEYERLLKWFKKNDPSNAQLINKLAKNDFDSLANSCDVGIILLRKEFTIPNFPSRLLTYLENKLPVFAITDNASDVGVIAEKNDFGKWVLYGDLTGVIKEINFFIMENSNRKKMGKNGFDFMQINYNSYNSFQLINQLFID